MRKTKQEDKLYQPPDLTARHFTHYVGTGEVSYRAILALTCGSLVLAGLLIAIISMLVL